MSENKVDVAELRGLDLATLRRAGRERQHEWTRGGDESAVGGMFRAVELGGEVGEALNIVKKLEREARDWRGSRATVAELAEEIADVVICADLLAAEYDIDLSTAVVEKFNATSDKVGLVTRLPCPSCGGELGRDCFNTGECAEITTDIQRDVGHWRQRAEASDSRVAELTAVCAKQEETIHQNDAERDASEARVARLRGALDLCMTGGNHIASLLVAKLGPGFSEMLPPDTDHDIALHRLCATDEYDMWCCWAASMRARDQALQEGE